MLSVDLPIIITNFKTYEKATGEKALELAKMHDQVAKETGVSIAIAVQPVDLRMISQSVDIPVLSQHIDAVHYGSETGHILPEAIVHAGARGTLLNHSERQIPLEVIERSIFRAKELGLPTVVCADSPESAMQIAKLHPDFIAVEPPELIGGDISVSTAKPEVIEEAVHILDNGKVLVGAGIKNCHDVRIALEKGAHGVLLASGVTKADDPYEVLKGLAQGVNDANC